MLCCEEGNSEMAELLLNSQADPNLQQSVSVIIIALYILDILSLKADPDIQQSVSGIILALYILDMYCIISK